MADLNFSVAQQIAESASFTNSFNPSSGDLPFGYYEPSYDGKIYWICSYDSNKKITSVLVHNIEGDSGRDIKYLSSLEEAIKIRDDLLASNWKPITTPEMRMFHQGKEVTLNRKQKKKMAKRVEQEIKKDSTMRRDIQNK